MSEVWTLVVGALAGLGASTLFLLALFIGVCVLLNFPKLRARRAGTLVVHSLDERLGAPVSYLPPDAPRGPVDQLRSGTAGAARS
jgi:hypothetical protein